MSIIIYPYWYIIPVQNAYHITISLKRPAITWYCIQHDNIIPSLRMTKTKAKTHSFYRGSAGCMFVWNVCLCVYLKNADVLTGLWWAPWWRHQMETFSALLAICAGNLPVPGEFSPQRPVTRSFGVFFDLRPNTRLGKQWRGWWFETQSRSLWRHRNDSACLLCSAGYFCITVYYVTP